MLIKFPILLIILCVIACGKTDISRPTSPQSATEDDRQKSLLDEINRVRVMRGLNPVVVGRALACAAQRHATDLGSKRFCSHTGSDGSSPWDRAKACGGVADGEIVACGPRKAQAAVSAWSNSPGHAAIMYDPRQTEVGIGVVNNYWVAIFL